MTVEQACVVREEQVRRGWQHDAHVHEPLHRDGFAQLALGGHNVPHEAIKHSPELREVGIRAKLLGDLEDFRLGNGLMQVIQILQRIPHRPNAAQYPLVEWKAFVRICYDLSIPFVGQAAL